MTGPTRPPSAALLAVAVGGGLGAVARYLLDTARPDSTTGFPWTTFAINVSGALLLSLLPALAPVRRSPLLTAALGAGVMGGYTTLSTYSEQTRALLGAGRIGVAGLYAVGTALACVVAVALGDRASTVADRLRVAAEGGDE